MDKKQYKSIERIIKGVASHRRVQIMDTLDHEPNQSVVGISEELALNFRTVSEHLRKLTLAGLVMKRHVGPAVEHALTTRGKTILKFCRTME